jgi:hypothetical protein
MHPTQTLPPDYTPYFTLDLSKSKRLVLLLNVLAIGLFIGFGYLFLRIAIAVLPDGYTAVQDDGLWSSLGFSLLVYLLMLVLHELVHGLFFWFFTRERPRFGFKGAYAFATAPGWYFPRRHYLSVGLAPLVVLSLLGLLILPVLPEGWLLPWLVATAGNASGAIGDLLIVGWLLTQPEPVLIQDQGDAVSAFRPS